MGGEREEALEHRHEILSDMSLTHNWLPVASLRAPHGEIVLRHGQRHTSGRSEAPVLRSHKA